MKKITITALALVVGAGILLPDVFLKMQSQSKLDKVEKVPEAYYSAAGTALARNMSQNLSTYERLQLIGGVWKSKVECLDSEDPDTGIYDALEQVRSDIYELYEQHLYPEDLGTEYENWYTWEAVPCQAVDEVFSAYSAEFWKFHFVRYDGSVEHTIYALSDGTVFLAEVVWREKNTAQEKMQGCRVFSEENTMAWLYQTEEQEEMQQEVKDSREIKDVLSHMKYQGFFVPEKTESGTEVKVQSQKNMYHLLQARGEYNYLFALYVE